MVAHPNSSMPAPPATALPDAGPGPAPEPHASPASGAAPGALVLFKRQAPRHRAEALTGPCVEHGQRDMECLLVSHAIPERTGERSRALPKRTYR